MIGPLSITHLLPFCAVAVAVAVVVVTTYIRPTHRLLCCVHEEPIHTSARPPRRWNISKSYKAYLCAGRKRKRKSKGKKKKKKIVTLKEAPTVFPVRPPHGLSFSNGQKLAKQSRSVYTYTATPDPQHPDVVFFSSLPVPCGTMAEA